MNVKPGKSSSGSPMCPGLHSVAESAPVLVSPSDADAGATADAAVPMLNRVFGVTGVRVATSLHPNPSDQTTEPPAPTATDTPGRFCSHTAARASSRARSTAAAYCGDVAVAATDGTVCGGANSGAVTTAWWISNAADAATTIPTTSAMRETEAANRLRAALRPNTSPTTISSVATTTEPGLSSAETP